MAELARLIERGEGAPLDGGHGKEQRAGPLLLGGLFISRINPIALAPCFSSWERIPEGLVSDKSSLAFSGCGSSSFLGSGGPLCPLLPSPKDLLDLVCRGVLQRQRGLELPCRPGSPGGGKPALRGMAALRPWDPCLLWLPLPSSLNATCVQVAGARG